MLTSPQKKLNELMAQSTLRGPQVTLSGRYHIEVRREGTVVHDTEFDNLILNQGLEFLGSNESSSTQFPAYCHVGTGTSTPVATQTQLDNRVGAYQRTGVTTWTPSSTPPYPYSINFVYAFPQGAVVGLLAEVGVASTADSGLFSRARILVGGVPSTLNVTAIDQLTVTYTLSLNFDLTPYNGSVTLGGVAYPYTAYNYSLGQSGSWYFSSPYNPYRMMGFLPEGSGNVQIGFTGNPPLVIDSATIATRTSIPGEGATHTYSGRPTSYVYTPGTYTAVAGIVLAESVANMAGGIQLIRAYFYTLGYTFNVLYHFPTFIPKDNTKQLNLFFDVSWAT